MIDTNVLAPLLAGSKMSWLRDAWERGAIIPLVNDATRTELTRVLQYRQFSASGQKGSIALVKYLLCCKRMPTTPPPAAIEQVVATCRDPSDVPFLILAFTGGAAALVTGDNDLLVLAPDFPVPILTPAAFRAHPALD